MKILSCVEDTAYNDELSDIVDIVNNVFFFIKNPSTSLHRIIMIYCKKRYKIFSMDFRCYMKLNKFNWKYLFFTF